MKSLEQVFTTLLKQLANEGKVIISWQDVQLWQEGVLAFLLKHKVIKVMSAAQSMPCSGCENQCVMDVITSKINHKARAFIVCENSDKQAHMGRIAIPLVSLSQWTFTVNQLAGVIYRLLNFSCEVTYSANNTVINLGMLKSDHGRKWVSLNTDPLSLTVNQHHIPVDDVLFINNDHLSIDDARIHYALNNAACSDQMVKPKISKREQQRAETRARYQSWKDEYKRLKQKYPDKPDTWIAKKIATLPIAGGASEDTIRKYMKK